MGQKPALDSATFDRWPEIENPQITNNGKYSMYAVSDKISGGNNLTICSNSTNWRFAISDIHSPAKFSSDSKRAFFINAHDSLAIVNLGGMKVDFVPNTQSFAVSDKGGDAWMAYLSKVRQELTIRECAGNKKLSFNNAQGYTFVNDGKSVVIISYDSVSHSQILKWIELSTGDTKFSWNGGYIANYQFDDSCIQLSFIGGSLKNDIERSSLFYFRLGMKAAVCKVSGDSLFKCGMALGQYGLQFSRNGDKLLFAVQKLDGEKPGVRKGETGVTIWNYKDSILQSIQRTPDYQEHKSEIWELMELGDSKIVPVKDDHEEFATRPDFENSFLVEDRNMDVAYWDPSLKLVSLIDGMPHQIILSKTWVNLHEISPDKSFVVWFDPDRLAYYDCEISTGTIRAIGKSVPVPLYDEEEVNMGRPANAVYGLCGWSVKDHSVYLYDRFDIWKVDLFGIDKPINVTNGYGRSNSLVLGRLDMEGVGDNINFDNVKEILLSAYNFFDKDNGIVMFDGDFKHRTIDGSIGPYSYCVARTGSLGYDQTADGNCPVKARDCEEYLVRRMNANTFPNIFLTADFKHFKQLSFLHPEKAYNWMTSKLMTWKKLDGQPAQGILYLPEDFDSTRKYPVLFECYEKMSDDLNDYLTPKESTARINIPYYVSNGYLVFEPDITWNKFAMGTGFANSIVSAVQYLSKYKWVDSTKIGLQGHSFGGEVANYIATHVHVLAAVCAASGFTDGISGYDELQINGRSCQGFFEAAQEGNYGIGVTPWTKPTLYMANSAFFNVGNTTIPLLLMHGSDDHNVPFAQSRELYLALRRAGKRVWFLEYENADHTLRGASAQDFTIRMKQFFDHYLKNAPAPVWMTDGVPYSHRANDSGLGLDLSGREP